MTSLDRLVLAGFRNYRRFVWEPERSPVVITGENGSGKTNLLEALSLLVPGRGLRGARNVDLPLRESATASAMTGWGVTARFSDDTSDFEVSTGMEPGQSGARKFLLDGVQMRARDVAATNLSAVWLTPQMDRLFGESASGRRRFLDRLVVAMVPQHAPELAACERATAQRNRFLSEGRTDDVWLSGIEDAMARHGVAVVAARREMVARLNVTGADPQGVFPSAHLSLLCPIADRLNVEPALAVEDWLRGVLGKGRPADRQRGHALVGAHRSDFILQDLGTGRQAAEASTGQQKALLIGIILAHARLMGESAGTAPMLLLDEPLVHLDERRRGTLLETLLGFQTPVLLTGTDHSPFAPLMNEASFITLRDGQIVPSTVA
ncbi:DNA replication/repair protein RecF [Acetobacter sp.]|jgi:DNA replication and repair protein RecF|uniref:DNA replication/repair protein RecF n=1 Tax=Acetobacter sp. TaxID=440 RepID=UPI0025C19487|nr:DNA replication/repair protein RecF [Acetobacter sp.]MCH4090671.1 DNA replication/repair protein RecF [Acetobacter sp.]MCI1300114.1 DNA replication/repair protein RecF [Acetobacter sp.]MCI1316532.1 DNA replication/repair protein RecF [Acetobacter sp.]